jgi:hypothetical protein
MEIQVSYSRDPSPLPSEDCAHEHKDLGKASSPLRDGRRYVPISHGLPLAHDLSYLGLALLGLALLGLALAYPSER